MRPGKRVNNVKLGSFKYNCISDSKEVSVLASLYKEVIDQIHFVVFVLTPEALSHLIRFECELNPH